jgi:hypothetical protein
MMWRSENSSPHWDSNSKHMVGDLYYLKQLVSTLFSHHSSVTAGSSENHNTKDWNRLNTLKNCTSHNLLLHIHAQSSGQYKAQNSSSSTECNIGTKEGLMLVFLEVIMRGNVSFPIKMCGRRLDK